MILKADLHNHTKYCNHAEGEAWELAEEAFKVGITHFGFSCHAPMNYDFESRMKLEEVVLYKNDIAKTKELFEGRMEILTAFEVDYFPGLMEESILGDKSLDYLIGSVHFINRWGVDHPDSIFRYKEGNINEIWEEYLEALGKMAEFGKFDIVGHFDLVKIFKFLPTVDIRPKLEETLKKIKRHGMVLEINASGLRKPIGEQYPSIEILQMANSLDIPITFSSDAHSPSHVGFGREQCEKLAKEAGYSKYVYFKQRDRIEIAID